MNSYFNITFRINSLNYKRIIKDNISVEIIKNYIIYILNKENYINSIGILSIELIIENDFILKIFPKKILLIDFLNKEMFVNLKNNKNIKILNKYSYDNTKVVNKYNNMNIKYNSFNIIKNNQKYLYNGMIEHIQKKKKLIKGIIKLIKRKKKDKQKKSENNKSKIPPHNNDDNGNSSLYNDWNNGLYNENIYINSKFINNIKKKYNININDITKIDVRSEGNCLMRCISLFVYKNENLYYRVRQEIANYLIVNKNNYVNIELETEDGLMDINQYIIYIQKDGVWGGELENMLVKKYMILILLIIKK